MALREEMSKPVQVPPHLRVGSRTAMCSTCRYFKSKGLGSRGACRLYGGYPVRATQVCDSYVRD